MGYQGDVLVAPNGDPSADDMALKSGTRYKLLAEAIPAKSFAVAANAVNEISLRGYDNFNMMDMKNPGQWPPERLNGSTGNKWLHSDFRAIALLYTHPMWKKMIDLGGLDQCDGC